VSVVNKYKDTISIALTYLFLRWPWWPVWYTEPHTPPCCRKVQIDKQKSNDWSFCKYSI